VPSTQPTDAFTTYLKAISAALKRGDGTEHTHRPALKALIESLEPPSKGLVATNEPRRVACGAPDFSVTRKDVPLGHIEAKDVGANLDEVERSDQLKRYLPALNNLILTDYLEFRWYVYGELRQAVRLARLDPAGRLRGESGQAQAVKDLFQGFLSESVPTVGKPKELAERMARMAQLIRHLIEQTFQRESVRPTPPSSVRPTLLSGEGGTEMSHPPEDQPEGPLHAQLRAFRDVLLPDLEPPEFADMYAQTIAYGLFAACANAPLGQRFTRQAAAFHLPKTNPFLRRLFGEIAGPGLDDRIAWAADNLAELLNRADMNAVLEHFAHKHGREDPVIDFYETFLHAYDPHLRELRGVYYTPEPVVSYIVRSVDHILRTRFNCPQGLADTSRVPGTPDTPPPGTPDTLVGQEPARDRSVPPTDTGTPDTPVGLGRGTGAPPTEARGPHRVLILDPACGTGTFLYFVIEQIKQTMAGQRGAWPAYVRDHLLPRLFGFELLMAPYAVAHMKLGIELKDTGYDFATDDRLGIYLTNTLEEARKQSELLFAQYIAEEANAASEIKRDKPIMVVLGNPPYSGHSANRSEVLREVPKTRKRKVRGRNGEVFIVETPVTKGGRPSTVVRKFKTWIGELIEDYRRVDGQPLGERNPKWLQDDYVKFIRFGQWRIEQTGSGVLAFISNHSYLDNPTFRGMRQQLMQTFDEIYILDLHGSTRKREVAPDGSKDQNVFDIQQGVAITLFVKGTPDTPLPGTPDTPPDGTPDTPVGPGTPDTPVGPGRRGTPAAPARDTSVPPTKTARVFHAELWGPRSGKYEALLRDDAASMDWTELAPVTPDHLFVPVASTVAHEYGQGSLAPDILPVHNVGIATARDRFVLEFDDMALWSRIRAFRQHGLSPHEARERYRMTQHQAESLARARDALLPDVDWEEALTHCLYRPFDTRAIFYHDALIERSRREVMGHLLAGANLGLITTRQTRDKWDVLCTGTIITHKSLAAYDINTLFPLYLYPAEEGEGGQGALGDASPWPPGAGGRRPNLDPQFVRDLEEHLGLSFTPDGKGDLGTPDAPPPGTPDTPPPGTPDTPVGPRRADTPNTPPPGTPDTPVGLGRGTGAPPTAEGGVGRDLLVRRHHLPHWQMGGSCYFITFRSARGSLPQECLAIAREVLLHDHGRRYDLHIATLMPDHVHAILQPREAAPGQWHDLAAITKAIKGVSARRINQTLGTSGTVWHAETFDRIIRDEEEYDEKARYCANNAVKAGLCDDPFDYEFLVIPDQPGTPDTPPSGTPDTPPSGTPDTLVGQEPARDRSVPPTDTGTPDTLVGPQATGTPDTPVGQEPARDKSVPPTGTFGPEDVFHYIYAILHSPTYRDRYAEFLKRDFPRIPLTSDRALFASLCAKGDELVGLHLMEYPRLDDFITTFDVPGDNCVEKVRYAEPKTEKDDTRTPGRVYINKTQYFEGVSPELWEFHVGGYQVMQKWLKDRKGRTLNFDDIKHYQKIAVALTETMRLMQEIDSLIPSWPLR